MYLFSEICSPESQLHPGLYPETPLLCSGETLPAVLGLGLETQQGHGSVEVRSEGKP